MGFKRIVVGILSVVLALSGCGAPRANGASPSGSDTPDTTVAATPTQTPDTPTVVTTPSFNGLDDPALLQYTQDAVLAELEERLGSDSYIVEEVQTTYVSKEYLEELSYNSQANIYFGYTLADLEAQLGDARFVFTLGDDGNTVVSSFEDYDGTFDQVAQNVAIGGGVILVCVVVTLVTGSAGAPAALSTVNAVFAASATTAAEFAASSGAFSAAVAGVTTYLEGGDIEASLKAAALEGSKAFKWGAIIGATTGGVSSAISLSRASRAAATAPPTPRQSELEALRRLGGREQASFLGGQEVPYGTPGATRPDVLTTEGGRLVATEVKNYDLENHLGQLVAVLRRQVTERAANLPAGSVQRIILDVRNRGYSEAFLSDVASRLAFLQDIDPTVVIEFMR